MSVGDVPNTKEPDPVSSVTAEAKLALDGVAKKVAIPVPHPDTPVEIGKPVALVNVPLVGVPSAGVTNVGLVSSTILPVPVTPLVSVTPPYVNSPFIDNVPTPAILPVESATVTTLF